MLECPNFHSVQKPFHSNFINKNSTQDNTLPCKHGFGVKKNTSKLNDAADCGEPSPRRPQL